MSATPEPPISEKDDSAHSLHRLVRALRRALRDIRDATDPHMGEYDNDIPQDPECFCTRCIAVRALRPNEKDEPRA